MDLGASAIGAWAQFGLTLLLGCFQSFWTHGTNVGGAVHTQGQKAQPSSQIQSLVPKKPLCKMPLQKLIEIWTMLRHRAKQSQK